MVGETFGVIFEDYASKIDYESWKIRLNYKGKEVQPLDTPQSLGMGPLAVAFVYGNFRNMNPNTHFKVFTIQQCDDNPIDLSFRCHKTIYMDRIYRVCADYAVAADYKVVLVRKSTIVAKVGFLTESGIKNGDRLFSLLLEV